MDDKKSFEARFGRLMEAANVKNDAEFARLLDINQSSVAAARKREQVPPGWVEKIADRFNADANWLFFGEGNNDLTKMQASCGSSEASDVDLIMIPMVEARLSAGHGSLQVSGESDRGYAFRSDFLHRKGNPKSMVLMRVDGDSMQPEIMDGDAVLLDQSKTDIRLGKIFAVGFEDAIYLKRIDRVPGKLILKSTNPAYPPLEIDVQGQEQDLFRVIGQVLWIGREY